MSSQRHKPRDVLMRLMRAVIWGLIVTPVSAVVSSNLTAHWSFAPLRAGIPPRQETQEWVSTPVDAFILRKLEENRLQPTDRANSLVLLRRACFDLTGLPPTPEMIEQFLADAGPQAYARLVERLLASPQYGERWGRHWLDVVRYADTGGFEQDYLYQTACSRAPIE